MSTPRTRLHSELTVLGSRNPLPSWTRSLADGEPAALRRLARCVRTYHHGMLGPSWPRISSCANTDRALRLHALRQGGAEAMLRTYGPSMRWRAPVLEVVYPVDRDLHLEGRGLLLVPSYFARSPVALADTALPPTLVYPARPRTADDTPRTHKGLAPLLGHTRAAVLQALGGDPTTTELARRAGGLVLLGERARRRPARRGPGLQRPAEQCRTACADLARFGAPAGGRGPVALVLSPGSSVGPGGGRCPCRCPADAVATTAKESERGISTGASAVSLHVPRTRSRQARIAVCESVARLPTRRDGSHMSRRSSSLVQDQIPSPLQIRPRRHPETRFSAGFRARWPAFRQPTRLMGGQCHRASMASGRGRYMRSATNQMPCCGVGSQLDSRSCPGDSGCR